MAVSIQLLRSSTASKRPTAANLAAGELGLNFNDSTSGLFYENASGNVMKVGPVEVSSAAPNASPASGGSTGNSLGELWYDTGNTALKIWDGDSWEITNSGATAGIVTSANATAITIGSNEQCTFSQSMILQGSDVTAEAALDFNVIDNTTQALRILGGGTELVRVTTTDGGEMLDVSTTTKLDGALDINGAVDCAGQVTFSAAQTLTIPDNTGFGLRVSSNGSEYVRFTTTDGAEVVDFSKAVKLDGGLTLGSGISVPAAQDITMVSGNSNAIDFVIDGGNRMMRFNTSTETVLLEQNLEVDGTATFDGTLDVDSTVDIAGGPVTFSANSKINIPDNANSAFIFQQGDSEPIMTVSTLDVLQTVTFDYRVIFDEDIAFTGSQHLFMTDNLTDAFSISEATNDYMVFATSNSGPKITTKKDLVQTPGSSVTPANNGELTVAATDNTTLTFSLKGSDGTVRTGTITLS